MSAGPAAAPDPSKLTIPYVQEGYLQEHYSPNLPRKKYQQQKENQRPSDEKDYEKSPRPTRKVNEYTHLLTKPNENLLNRNEQKNVEIHASVRRNQLNNNTKNNIVQFCDNVRLISNEKKKLKFSPPPESGNHNSDKSFDNLSNRGSVRVTKRLLTAMFRGGLKLKERLLVGVSVATVLFTLLLVLDLQMDTGMTGTHLLPSHGRFKVGEQQAFNGFRNRILQKTSRLVGFLYLLLLVLT